MANKSVADEGAAVDGQKECRDDDGGGNGEMKDSTDRFLIGLG